MNGLFLLGGVLGIVYGIVEAVRTGARWRGKGAASPLRQKLVDASLPFFAIVYGLYLVQDSTGLWVAPTLNAAFGVVRVLAFVGLVYGLLHGSWSSLSSRR